MSEEINKKYIVFDIERYATKDGPGIRTVVFLKGCNLRCLWCQNPESQSGYPQIMYYRSECSSCGRCIEACPQRAIHNDPVFGLITDHSLCKQCGTCIDTCYNNARRIIGHLMSVDEVFKEIVRDKAFYQNSGGGVTFSGGEPLLQVNFVTELAKKCREVGIHTAIETAGMVSLEVLKSITDLVDLIYFDFKHIDFEEYLRTTGTYPRLIQENLKWISRQPVKLIIRIPIIPDINNSNEIIYKMFNFIKENTSAREIELLAFHRLGLSKYEGLGMEYAMKNIKNLEDSDCEELAVIGRKMGLTVHTGISKR